jgi:predicted permease
VVRETLVASQVMLTIVLLAGSISVGRAFVRLMQADRGFERAGLATVSVSLMGTTHEGQGRNLAYFEDVLERVRRLPGVSSASATESLPLDAQTWAGGLLGLDGHPASVNSIVIPVLANYFRTMGGSLLAGREFTETDIRSRAPVAVVNEHFADEFGAPADAIGHSVTIGRNWKRKIIGVAKNIDYMADGASSNEVYVPSQTPGGFLGSTFVIRVAGRAEDRLPMLQQVIQSVDPRVPIFGAKTMEQRLDDVLARPQFYRTSVLCFAVFALLLSVIGIYGVVSYTVARRTHEMGVRMALGATPAGLRAAFIRQGLATIAAGAVPGVLAAVLSGQFLESLVEGAKPADAATYAGAVIAIAAIAAAGIWTATRPVARLDIVETLRAE